MKADTEFLVLVLGLLHHIEQDEFYAESFFYSPETQKLISRVESVIEDLLFEGER